MSSTVHHQKELLLFQDQVFLLLEIMMKDYSKKPLNGVYVVCFHHWLTFL